MWKGKGFPLQAWSGSWGSRRLRLLDHLDIRHYEGGKVVTLTHRPSLPPGVFLVVIFRGWVDPRAHGSVGSLGKNPQRQNWGSMWLSKNDKLKPVAIFVNSCVAHGMIKCKLITTPTGMELLKKSTSTIQAHLYSPSIWQWPNSNPMNSPPNHTFLHRINPFTPPRIHPFSRIPPFIFFSFHLSTHPSFPQCVRDVYCQSNPIQSNPIFDPTLSNLSLFHTMKYQLFIHILTYA
jgi:hypothetical protein